MAMHGTHLTCGSLLLALAVAGQGLGAAPGQAGEADAGVCIGVLGAVAHPGAYAFANEVDLETVLRAAGGAREEAADTVRIVRDGQVRFTVARSAQRTLPLRSNDFVIVERLRASPAGRSDVYLPRELRPGGRSSHEGSTGLLHIGLANVTGRPVVSAIPQSHATILDILDELHQSAEILSTVRAIHPLNSSENAPSAGRLPADSVLVFDRSTIQASRLPKFPPAVHVTPPAASGPLLLAVSRNEAPPERDVKTPAAAFSDASEGFEAAAEAAGDEVTVVEVTAVDESIAPAPQQERGRRDEVPEQSMVDWRLAVLAVGAIAVLAASLRMRSGTGTRPKRKPIGRLEPVMLPIIEAPERPRLLDALIEDRLTVFEEACRLPAVLEFFGRPAAAAAARTDAPPAPAPVEIAAPHFARVAGQPVSGSNTDRSALEAAPQIDGPNRRADASHAFETAHRPHTVPQADGKPSVLDRILTRLDKEARA